LAADSEVCAGYSVSSEVGDIDFVEVWAAERQIRRSAEEDTPAVVGDQLPRPIGSNSPDFVRGIAADVKVAISVQREAVG
jgi:hypothetical protein